MDLERTMEFLLQQQARFAEQQTRFAERQAEHDERQRKFEDDLLQINSVLLEVAASQERSNEIVSVLAERQVKTEQVLQTLIATLERHIADHN